MSKFTKLCRCLSWIVAVDDSTCIFPLIKLSSFWNVFVYPIQDNFAYFPECVFCRVNQVDS